MNPLQGRAEKLCSRFIRRVPCPKCLHFKECARKGTSCAPSARWLLELEARALPAVEAWCKWRTRARFELSLTCPLNREEEEKHAFVSIRVSVWGLNPSGRWVYHHGRVPVPKTSTEEELKRLTLDEIERVERTFENER